MSVTPRSLVVVLTAAAALASAPPAAAEDPPYVDWAGLLPSATSPSYEPTSEDDCRAGRARCLDSMLRAMDRRLDPLADRCDHDAVFSLSYLRTTEEFQRSVAEPGFYADPRFIVHEGAVFASYYFDAYDDWHRGDRAGTPGAWAIAFDAAADRELSAAGNLLLGMNAHIQRDRPFVLAAIGIVRPDGSSRKYDNDRVNHFLNRVSDTLVPEIARRFDPTVDDANLPTLIDDMITFQMIPAWREIAWRNAERLLAAPTPEARAKVAAEIEAYAASQALLIRRLTAYVPYLQNSEPRDAFCAANHDG
jgi:hypothetical protein